MHPVSSALLSMTDQQYAPSSRFESRPPRPRSSADLRIRGPLGAENALSALGHPLNRRVSAESHCHRCGRPAQKQSSNARLHRACMGGRSRSGSAPRNAAVFPHSHAKAECDAMPSVSAITSRLGTGASSRARLGTCCSRSAIRRPSAKPGRGPNSRQDDRLASRFGCDAGIGSTGAYQLDACRAARA